MMLSFKYAKFYFTNEARVDFWIRPLWSLYFLNSFNPPQIRLVVFTLKLYCPISIRNYHSLLLFDFVS